MQRRRLRLGRSGHRSKLSNRDPRKSHAREAVRDTDRRRALPGMPVRRHRFAPFSSFKERAGATSTSRVSQCGSALFVRTLPQAIDEGRAGQRSDRNADLPWHSDPIPAHLLTSRKGAGQGHLTRCAPLWQAYANDHVPMIFTGRWGLVGGPDSPPVPFKRRSCRNSSQGTTASVSTSGSFLASKLPGNPTEWLSPGQFFEVPR